ncbi:MAG: tetratricopeptide repeat protein [Chloroflexi bacterium]|nr:tetratricopeptide repeat protein [Chloroflexota bacterium]NOG33345.1 tetratricopeptide repeat protein [Chloroflexota bacterium]GIK56169.1 MAG: hypothetical protein BroJett015_18320 [Chloroflexota bacterium]
MNAINFSQADDPLVQLLTGREFEKLVTVAQLSERGAFVIARYSTPASRTALVEALRRRVAPLPIYEHTLTTRQPDVKAYLEQLPPAQKQQRAVVCLYDIESAGPQAIRLLDQRRDQLAAYPHTLILWIQPQLWGKLALEAPNIFSGHSGVFDLRLPGGHFTRAAETTPTWSYSSLAEWQQLVDQYETLLAEYEASPHDDPRARFDLHYRLARLYQDRSDFALARPHYHQAYALLELEADPAEQAEMLYRIGQMYYYDGDQNNALEILAQALGLFRQVGDRLGEANVLQAIGDVQNFRDERDAALASYEQALGLFRQVGARLGEANVLAGMGFLKLDQGDGEEGVHLLQAALDLHTQVGSRVGQSNICWQLGMRFAQAGRLAEAEPLMDQAVTLSNQFAPGHPVTVYRESVLAQVQAQLNSSASP